MAYVGLHKQIQRNNLKSVALLLSFPALILLGVFVVLAYLTGWDWNMAVDPFLSTIPYVIGIVGIWFAISYFFHNKMIQGATRARPLERRENMRVYNLTENLCMSVGMRMPALYIIDSPALNAYASGINEKSYAVTLTKGIIDALTDEELEGVIAHELMHIRNKDVRLLIVTIVFVGIFGVIVDILFRNILYGNVGRRRNDKDQGSPAIIVIFIVAIVLYFLSMIFKFALSRSREYMADAGAVSMTRNSLAMANALRKVSGRSNVKTTNDEVKELFLDNTPTDETSKGFLGGIGNLFSTHPPIEKRIQVLERM